MDQFPSNGNRRHPRWPTSSTQGWHGREPGDVGRPNRRKTHPSRSIVAAGSLRLGPTRWRRASSGDRVTAQDNPLTTLAPPRASPTCTPSLGPTTVGDKAALHLHARRRQPRPCRRWQQLPGAPRLQVLRHRVEGHRALGDRLPRQALPAGDGDLLDRDRRQLARALRTAVPRRRQCKRRGLGNLVEDA